MRGKLKTWVGEVSSKFSVIDIYGDKRTELNANVLEYVKDKFYEYGIVIDSVNVSRIGLDAQTEEAIQLKINEQQELETARLDKEKAEIQAEADAKKIEAQSEANRMISESLTEELLKLEQIQKWSGEVPQVQGASTPIISLD